MTGGSCVWLRAEHNNHLWSCDFVVDRTMDERKIRLLNILAESIRECLARVPKRNWRNHDVIESLSDCMLQKGVPIYLRSDNGSEFTANTIRKWRSDVGIITVYIEPGSPWGNGYIESFNSRMRDEFLNGERLANLYQVLVLMERWVRYYNQMRPHGSLGGRSSAPQTIISLTA
ncbi:MAG: integrase core domain-containing protein [Clostridia bacterium]